MAKVYLGPCQLYTAPKIKFSIKDFFSKCDQIRRKLFAGLLDAPLCYLKQIRYLINLSTNKVTFIVLHVSFIFHEAETDARTLM